LLQRIGEVSKLIIEKRIDINGKCPKYLRSALHYLLLCKENVLSEFEIATLLSEKGIDVNAKDKNGMSAIESLYCQSFQGLNFVELSKILLESGVDIHGKSVLEKNALIGLFRTN